MKVFLDDERPEPKGWIRTFSVEETIDLLKLGRVTHLSLDNDLGDGNLEGFKVLDWLEETVHFDKSFIVPIIRVHSANPVRVASMKQVAAKLELIRLQQDAYL